MSALPVWGRVYVVAVAVLGAATLAHSLATIHSQTIGWNWFVLAALTLLTGSATVKLPSVPATISISETFVITSTLLYGAAAGTLTVALDALVISYLLARRGHPVYRVVFNICALPASLWLGAQVFFWMSELPPLATFPVDRSLPVGTLLEPLLLFTTVYFALNSWLIAVAIAVEKGAPPIRVWRENFAWLSLNYFGGASVAALLVAYARDLDYGFIAIIIPLLAVLYFTFSSAMGRVEDTNRHLRQLNALYMSTIETLAMAIDAKDQITHGHIRRVQQYAVALAKTLGITDTAQISAIEAASLLHDMGKLAVPEYILNKPGPLTPAEFEKMKLHASVGADILSAIEFPYPVVPIVRHHHENWDGSGYPDGICGPDIPIGARILAVVDCFDALTSDRPYRPRLADSAAIKILLERRGRMYDPVVVDTFVSIHQELSTTVGEQPAIRNALSAITQNLSALPSSRSLVRFDEINASSEETTAMFELARELAGSQTFSSAAETINRYLRRIVPASTFVLYTFDEQADELEVAFASGEHAAHFSGLRIGRGQRLSGWVAANSTSALNSDPVLDLGDSARSLKPPLRSYLGTAISAAGRLIGVLSVYSPQTEAFSDDHQRVLESIGRQTAKVLDQATKSENAVLKRGDSSVNVQGAERLEDFISRHRGLSVPILLIDIDIPSRDTFMVERAISAVLTELNRDVFYSNTVFRYSESSVIVPLTTLDRKGASELVADVAKRLSHTVPTLSTVNGISVGMAVFPHDGNNGTSIVDVARRRSTRVGDSPTAIH